MSQGKGLEYGRLGRNVRQRFLCGFCPKEGTRKPIPSVMSQTKAASDQELNTTKLLIKIAGVRHSRCNSSACAYEAKDMQGVIKLYGVASSNASSTNGAVQEALMEAVITANNYGFNRTPA